MSLRDYQRKRRFDATAEPRPGRKPARSGNRFVVQKHAASRLHYDFRLELNGVLKSWAVPKGIPREHGARHLAVEVEDHPIEYFDFEGIIPRGQYGGGTVMVWDQGTYQSDGDPAEELKQGKLHLELKGKKLKGPWHLVRLREANQWLLIRGGPDLPPLSRKTEDASVVSGKSMKQLAASDRVWESSSQPSEKTNPSSARPAASRKKATRQKPAAGTMPRYIEPMKARLVDAPPPGEWLYEIKFDGFRAIAVIRDADIQLLSRNEKDLGARFPEIIRALGALKVEEAILDGEIVALDSEGRSSFQLLQASDMGATRPPIAYYLFDVPWLNGEDLRGLPLVERKAQLEKLLKKAPGVLKHSAALGNDMEALLEQARKLGLEGLIGKRPASTYEEGARSGAWIKLKIQQTQEFVIGGYTDPGGTRTHFGAILVGYYKDRKLRFAGKVGTGFNQKSLRYLSERFAEVASSECPFMDLPQPSRGGAAGLTRAEMRSCHWLLPKLVCQIKFAEWTRDGKLRQPVFEGLRDDKNAEDVIRESA